MIVDQVDDLTMLRRQSGQCPAQQLAPILFLQCDFRVIRRIRDGGLDFFVQFGAFCSPPTCRQGLMASNRLLPRRDRGAALEATRLTPHIEKNLAQEVLGKRLIADEPKKPAVDVGPMPGEQSLHRWFAASADTAATAAGCGRTDTLSMRGSPRSRFPPKQCWRPGCGSSFFRRQLQNTVSACVFLGQGKGRGI